MLLGLSVIDSPNAGNFKAVAARQTLCTVFARIGNTRFSIGFAREDNRRAAAARQGNRYAASFARP